MSPVFAALDERQPVDDATDQAIDLPESTDSTAFRYAMALEVGRIAEMMFTAHHTSTV